MITTHIQIRFSDIDVLKHVNNIVLQQYYDLGKVEYFQKVLGVSPMWVDHAFIAASTQTDYFEEVKVDNKIAVRTSIAKIGTKSITFQQEIIEPDSDRVKSSSKSVLVAFDLNERCSMEILPKWRKLIEEYEAIEANR